MEDMPLEEVTDGICITVTPCPKGFYHGAVIFNYMPPLMSPGHWVTPEDAFCNARACVDQMKAAERQYGK